MQPQIRYLDAVPTNAAGASRRTQSCAAASATPLVILKHLAERQHEVNLNRTEVRKKRLSFLELDASLKCDHAR
jgi:hypothetical protein